MSVCSGRPHVGLEPVAASVVAASSMSPVEIHPIPVESLARELLAGYAADPRGHHIGRRFLPSRDEAISLITMAIHLIFPGYFGRKDLNAETLPHHVAMTLASLRDGLEKQIDACLCYQDESGGKDDGPRCKSEARRLTADFMAALPGIRSLLLEDVEAAYVGDPAATSLDEIILAYPGLLAVAVHRIAHKLYSLGVPVMPRMMAEWAHSRTGADIHPGATIGRRFFLDHATGVVVGETSHLGDDVKVYQGVTLGALSFQRDERGRLVRGTKRHPTVENNVTIYANATVLGGTTVVGEGSVIGGSVFITKSVPARSRVALRAPDLQVDVVRRGAPADEAWVIDFEI